MRRHDLVDEFLLPIANNVKIYETAKLLLEACDINMSQASQILGIGRKLIYIRVEILCDALEIEGYGLLALRAAYTSFLENKIAELQLVTNK